MEEGLYEFTEEDVTAMVKFLGFYLPEAANRGMARKILEQMKTDVHSATQEEVIEIYKSITDQPD